MVLKRLDAELSETDEKGWPSVYGRATATLAANAAHLRFQDP